MQQQSRAPSPPIPMKPNHLKGVETLSLDTLNKNEVENPGPPSETSNPFDDKFESLPNSINSSSSSSYVANINSIDGKELEHDERAYHSSPQILIECSSPSSDPILSLNSQNSQNPFSNSAAIFDKPHLPPRPLLPPRPSVTSSITSGHSLSTSSPNLIRNDKNQRISPATIGVIPVDRQKNENSSIFKKPPPLSRLSASTRKISGSDGYNSGSGGSIQTSGVIKLREDVHIPNCDKTYKSLPVPEHLANHEIHLKGFVRGLAISGFYIATIGNLVPSFTRFLQIMV